jgi:hypothetical protein
MVGGVVDHVAHLVAQPLPVLGAPRVPVRSRLGQCLVREPVEKGRAVRLDAGQGLAQLGEGAPGSPGGSLLRVVAQPPVQPEPLRHDHVRQRLPQRREAAGDRLAGLLRGQAFQRLEQPRVRPVVVGEELSHLFNAHRPSPNRKGPAVILPLPGLDSHTPRSWRRGVLPVAFESGDLPAIDVVGRFGIQASDEGGRPGAAPYLVASPSRVSPEALSSSTACPSAADATLSRVRALFRWPSAAASDTMGLLPNSRRRRRGAEE